MINVCFYLLNLFFGILGEDVTIIVITYVLLSDMVNQCGTSSTPVQGLPEGEQKESCGYELIVRMIQFNQVTDTLDKDLLDLCSGDTIIELNT